MDSKRAIRKPLLRYPYGTTWKHEKAELDVGTAGMLL